MEAQPLLASSSDGQTPSLDTGTTSTSVASQAKRSLTNDNKQPDSSQSSGFSLRFFKTTASSLPTVWKSQPTDSFQADLVERRAHGPDHDISPLQFFMQVVRGSVGTGVLALPSAVANAGLVFGLVGVVLTSVVIIHSINLLVSCAHFLRERFGLDDVHLDYGCTVDYSFVFGTSSARRFRWTSRLLNVSLGLVQFGIAVVYVIFVSENVRYLVDFYQPSFGQPLVVYMACVAVLIFPFIFVRSVRVLANISGVGNALMVVSMALIFAYCVQDLPPLSRYPLITDFQRIPLFFGVAVFSFESVNIVLPTEMALTDKRHLMGCTGLLNTSFAIVLILYVAVAFFGYAKFGEDVKGSLTYSLLPTPWYSRVVMPIYALLIAMSFGLQFYILMEIVWQAFTAVAPHRFHRRCVENVLRTLVYLVVVGVAAGVPLVEHVISLTGALAGSSICLIFPPLIHTVLFWDHSYKFRCFRLVVAKNMAVIAFGIFGAIIGSYTSVLAIYNDIHKAGQAQAPK